MNRPELHLRIDHLKNRTLWQKRYADRHRLVRITEFPGRTHAPKRVRIYARQDHYVLQFWDPAFGRTLYDRVSGDLIDAIARARELDHKLENSNTTGKGCGRISHQELVERYLSDLGHRADAGEISPATPRRFASALGHYLAFTSQPATATKYPHAGKVDRTFAFGFAAYLQNLQVTPNGRPNAQRRRMTGQRFVLHTLRSMFEWGIDPERGGCLLVGAINPFRIATLASTTPQSALVGEPDITVTMAAEFLRACDVYQVRLFAPMILLGLRAAEPLLLFHEHFTTDSLDVKCIPELDYRTKGVRDKRLPLIPALARVLHQDIGTGLLYRRREVIAGNDRPPIAKSAFEALVQEHRRRCATATDSTAASRVASRNRLLQDAGGLTYKMIQTEFMAVKTKLQWPKSATLKDFRHLFATCMSNAGLPEHERQYLMGQSPGKAVILHYTHVNRLREHYLEALRQEMGPILEILNQPHPPSSMFSN